MNSETFEDHMNQHSQERASWTPSQTYPELAKFVSGQLGVEFDDLVTGNSVPESTLTEAENGVRDLKADGIDYLPSANDSMAEQRLWAHPSWQHVRAALEALGMQFTDPNNAG